MTELRTLLRMGALALMWGSSFFWIKFGLTSFTPVQLVLIRLVLGAAVLLLIARARGQRMPRGRRIWLHLTVAALLHNSLPFLLFSIGELTVDSGTTGVLNSTTPLWALLVTLLAGHSRRPGPAGMAGLGVGMAGLLLIFAPWQSSGLLSWGALACVAASFSYGLAFVYEDRHLTGTGCPAEALAGSQMLAASVLVLFALPAGGLAPVHPHLGAIVGVLVLGVFSTGIAFAMNYRLLAVEGAVATSTVGYLIPLVSLVLGTLFLNENLDLRVVAGMVIVLGGVALTRVRRQPRAPAEPVLAGVAQTSLRSEAQRESS